ncbi:MAG TPA: NapC/NirT family cytochrome c, partial [Terriglobales bacterium]|nr:NapC/NirT family cytochrome c [Terriglobales bacterium]
PLAWQPLSLLIPVAVIYLAAWAGVPGSVENASLSLHGVNNLIIAVFALWILFRVPWFFAHAAVATAFALIGYAACLWLRFIRSEKAVHSFATVLLGSGGFLFLLYSHSQVTLTVGAVLGLLALGDLYSRGVLRRAETSALTFVGAYLLFTAFTSTHAMRLPLGYLVLAAMWLHLGLELYRPEEVPILGPHPAPLPRLVPLFGAGIVLALVPVVLFYPWEPVLVAFAYLSILFVLFWAIGRELANHAVTLLGVGLARALAALGRVAPFAALAYLAWLRFPASYSSAAVALFVGLVSLLAGWRQAPRMFPRRNVYAYQAGVFLTLAYFLAERRLAASGIFATALDSSALLLLGLIAAGYWLRNLLPRPYVQSLYDVAAVPAAVACILQVTRDPSSIPQALFLGGVLVVAALLALIKARQPAVLFTLPVVLGFWIYVIQWSAGIRGEALGLPYLVFGFISAGVGYLLLRKQNRWYELSYFAWFLCTGVSLILFYPYHAAGAYTAALWPIAYLLIGRTSASWRDTLVASALEAASGVLAAYSVAVLLFAGLYTAAATALFIYALLYAWIAVTRRISLYFYPTAACAVAGYFLVVFVRAGARVFLPYFLPLAVAFYFLAAWFRDRQRLRDAYPFELATSAAAVLGAFLFLTLPFGHATTTGWLTGAAYLVLFVQLARYTQERAFLAGAGLAGVFAIYEFLPALPGVTQANRLGIFIPAAFLLALLGRLRHRAQDARGSWSLYAAAIATTLTGSFFALWPAPASLAASRVVLLVAMAVWVALLIWTRQEIFIYCATLGLALLAYNFVQSSADIFGQHLVAFFLYGSIALGLVFLASAARRRLSFRQPLLFVPPAHWYGRFAYVLPIGVLALATFGSWGVSTSSNPHFCGSCHDMGTYFANWKTSAHARADISCDKCHYEPGLQGFLKAKFKGTSQLVATITQTQAHRPVAAVNNATCLSSGCHSMETLRQPLYVHQTYFFSHANHLRTLNRGPDLRCTSCHTAVGTESHFAVDTNACFTCHFKAAGETQPATTIGCVGCHGVPTQTAAGFDHVAGGVKADDAACMSCHEHAASGSPAVEARQCHHCHAETPATLLTAGTSFIHSKHVTDKGVACDWCHGVVKHGKLDVIASVK